MKLLFHSQASTAALLKFGNGKVISPTLYNGWNYLYRFKLIHVSKSCLGSFQWVLQKRHDSYVYACNLHCFCSDPLAFLYLLLLTSFFYDLCCVPLYCVSKCIIYRADSRFVPSQLELSLQSNSVSHWLGTNQESALIYIKSNLVMLNLF